MADPTPSGPQGGGQGSPNPNPNAPQVGQTTGTASTPTAKTGEQPKTDKATGQDPKIPHVAQNPAAPPMPPEQSGPTAEPGDTVTDIQRKNQVASVNDGKSGPRHHGVEAPKKEEAPKAPPTKKFRLKENVGAHFHNRVRVNPGDTVDLTEAQQEAFRDKFIPV